MKERQILDGKYVVVRPLGEGATGALFEAENLLLGKRVAVKVVHEHLVEDDGARQRVVEKARQTATLEHPNICGPLDLGGEEGTPYIVTEMLGGPSLQKEISSSGPHSVASACDLILQVLAALDYAHDNGVVHGGLHSRNVHVVYPRPGVPWVKVTDFGLAVALRTRIPSRDEPFLAPECQRGRPAPASDVYSAAALLFALLEGTPPPDHDAVPSSSAIPAALRTAIAGALRADPAARTNSAQAFATQLAAYTLALPTSGEFRLSLPPTSLRWIQGPGSVPSPQISFGPSPSEGPAAASAEISAESAPNPQVTESLLRNPRFPSNRHSPWTKRWRQLRTHLATHPNVGAAWLFALASLGAGIACALLAAWL